MGDSRKLSRKGTPFIIREREGVKLLIDGDWEEEALMQILFTRAERLSENPVCELIPTCEGSLVFRLKGRKGDLYLKHFRTFGWAERAKAVVRGTRAERSWRGGDLLHRLGFRTPPLVALGRSSTFFSPPVDFLLTEAVRGPRLKQMVKDGFEDHLAAMGWRKGPFLKMLVLTIAELHRKGIYHGDLNPTNILVDLKGDLSPSTFCFLDNARCRSMKKVPYQLRLRDLSGLNHLRLDSISVRDRLRFFSLYREQLGTQDGIEMVQQIRDRSIRPRRGHGKGS